MFFNFLLKIIYKKSTSFLYGTIQANNDEAKSHYYPFSLRISHSIISFSNLILCYGAAQIDLSRLHTLKLVY